MPEVNNGIPTGGSLPGLDEKFTSYNAETQGKVDDLTQALNQNQTQEQGFRDNVQDKGQQDKTDTKTKDQIEAEKKAQEEALITACIAKAMQMHRVDFENNNMQINSVKTLSMSGQDKTDTVRLDISTRDDNFQMYFDKNADLIIENHKERPEETFVGDKYLDELDDPEKQKSFVDRADIAKERTVLSKDQIDKQAQEMGFDNKADLEKSTGMDLSGGASGHGQLNQMRPDQLKTQAADEILKNADMVVSGNTKFNSKEKVNDVLGTQGAKTIAVIGRQAYTIDESGQAEKTNLRATVGSVSATQIQGDHVIDARIGPVLYNVNNPTEGIGVGKGGTPLGVKNPNSEVAMARSLTEQPNTNTAKVDEMFNRYHDTSEHAKDMYQSNGYELVNEMHTNNDSVGNELSEIAKKYGIEVEKVDQMYHDSLANGKTPEEAMAQTRQQCADIDAAERHEPIDRDEIPGPNSNLHY